MLILNYDKSVAVDVDKIVDLTLAEAHGGVCVMACYDDGYTLKEVILTVSKNMGEAKESLVEIVNMINVEGS